MVVVPGGFTSPMGLNGGHNPTNFSVYATLIQLGYEFLVEVIILEEYLDSIHPLALMVLLS